MAEPKGQEGGQKGGTEGQKIKVGEKEYTAADINNILSENSANAQKAQQAAQILDAAKSYGVEPDEFLQQAVGAFSVIQGLISDGVLDEEGRVKKQPAPKTKEPKPKEGDDDFNLDDILNPDKKKGDLDMSGVTKGTLTAMMQAVKSLESKMGQFESRLDETDGFASSLARQSFEDKIMAKHPNLNSEDIQKLFGQAASLRRQGKRADLYELAEQASGAKESERVSLEKAFAEKHGLNYEELVKAKEDDPNKLDEKSPMDIPFLKGKKVSVEPGENNVHPSVAVREYLNKQLSGEQ